MAVYRCLSAALIIPDIELNICCFYVYINFMLFLYCMSSVFLTVFSLS